MTTTFYFHNASSTQTGTLPSTKQTTQTIVVNFDAFTVNRTMDTTIGTSQTDKSTTGASSGIYYVTRFISPPLNQTSIAANTWTLGIATWCNSTVPVYPGDSSNSKMHGCLYVWRPSTGAKIASIFDGLSSTTTGVVAASLTEKTTRVSFTGAAAASIAVGDVLICESLVSVFSSGKIYHYDFDGTTDITSDNTSISSAASSISTPENINFVVPITSIDCTVTTLNLQNKFITKI